MEELCSHPRMNKTIMLISDSELTFMKSPCPTATTSWEQYESLAVLYLAVDPARARHKLEDRVRDHNGEPRPHFQDSDVAMHQTTSLTSLGTKLWLTARTCLLFIDQHALAYLG